MSRRLEFRESAIKIRSFLTPEEFKAQDILRFGTKIQITKLPRIGATDKQDIRKKIKELEDDLRQGTVRTQDVKSVKDRVKKLKQILNKGVIPLFELKFQELQDQIKKGNVVGLENLKSLAEKLDVIFAEDNIINLNTLGAEDLRSVLAGLKTTRFNPDWEEQPILRFAQAKNAPKRYISGVQYTDKNRNPQLIPITMAYAIINHDKITKLQDTRGRLSIEQPIWVWDVINGWFDHNNLSALVSIGRNSDFYLDHRAIIPRSWDIDSQGKAFDTGPGPKEEKTEEEEEIEIEEEEL